MIFIIKLWRARARLGWMRRAADDCPPTFSASLPPERWQSVVGLPPSGPDPIPTAKMRAWLSSHTLTSPPAPGDETSSSAGGSPHHLTHRPSTSTPAYRRFLVTGNADLPGLARAYRRLKNLMNIHVIEGARNATHAAIYIISCCAFIYVPSPAA